MKKLKDWLIKRILPIWARNELISENAKLRRQVEELQIDIRMKNEYIDGLTDGIRAQRRIIINAGEVKK